MIWFVVLNILMNDGTLYTNIHYPNDPKYNNEQDCKQAGQELADQKQLEIGTQAGKTYFMCGAITAEEIKKALKPSGTDI